MRDTGRSLVPGPHRLRALALIAGMAIGCVSIWTVSPLVWLWIASQMEAGGPPSMGAIAVVILGVAFTTIAIGKLLAVLHARYRDLSGTRQTIRLHLSWLRSMRGERPHETGPEVELNVLDVILIASIFIALGLYDYWFLFLSDSPIDFRTGRK
jgi:hypothetical protein